MTKIYGFKRDFYNEVKNGIDNTHVLFLIGPRKTGKTICLYQIGNDWNRDVRYIDFKKIKSDDDKIDILNEITDSIKDNKDILYLLDEFTYILYPASSVEAIANAISEDIAKGYRTIKTKVIITGSQSVALESWAYRSFAGNCGIVYTDFLSYREWLRYCGRDDISEESYMDFLYRVHEFYQFDMKDEYNAIEEYLQGCLNETVISNQNSENMLFGNNIDDITVDTLLQVLYVSLFTLHESVKYETMIAKDKLVRQIQFYFRELKPRLKQKEIIERISDSIVNAYQNIKSRNEIEIERAVLFLMRINLLTVTPIVGSAMGVPNIKNRLIREDGTLNFKDNLFESYNVCIRYPMFYVACLRDILKERMPDVLPRDVLGRIVECHVRGLLPNEGAFEFHDKVHYDKEVDYVNISHGLAVESSIWNKPEIKTHFKDLPEPASHCDNILLSQDWEYVSRNNIINIPYYLFIYDISNVSIQDVLNNILNTEKMRKSIWRNITKEIEGLSYDDKNDKITDFLCHPYITKDNITNYIDEAIQLEECDAEVTDLLDKIEEARPEMSSIVQEIRNR